MGAPDELKVGDLVQKISGPRSGCLAIVTDLSMKNYFDFTAWIRIAYVDNLGGYEWVQYEGLRILIR